MKKSSFYGWKSVYLFTIKQLLKSKGNLFMMGLFFVVTLVAYPVMAFKMSGDNTEKTRTSIEKLYVMDESGLGIKEWLKLDEMEHKGIVLPGSVEFTDKKVKTKDNAAGELDLNAEENKNAAYISLSYNEKDYYFDITGLYSSAGNVSGDDVTDVCNVINNGFRLQMAESRGVTAEQLTYLGAEVETGVEVYEADKGNADDNKDEAEHITSGEYGILTIVMCVIICLVSLGGEQIAGMVLQEKASKLVEFLLTSVRPLALLIGKILAGFTLVLMDVAVLVTGVCGSVIITNQLFPNNTMDLLNSLSTAMSYSGDTVSTISIQPFVIPFAILMVLLGVLFYSVIAALAGATVNRMEELTEGMKIFTGLLIAGSYFALFSSMMDMNGGGNEGIKMAAALLPFSSLVYIPAYLLVGKVSIGIAFLSLGILLASTIFILWFASRVYESMIYHKGTPLKLKDVIELGKKGGNNNE